MHTILTDMAGAYIEHSDVITAFTSIVYSQLKNSMCRVYPDNVQYKWMVDGAEKTVIPDATINCRVHAKKGNSFYDIPRFVMEVLSDSTKKYDWRSFIFRISRLTLMNCLISELFCLLQKRLYIRSTTHFCSRQKGIYDTGSY